MTSREELLRKRLAAAENMAVRSRNYRRARERALTALARLHKEDYFALLEIEKAKDEQAGKRWGNLAGPDVYTNAGPATDHSGKNRRDPSDLSQNKGNDE